MNAPITSIANLKSSPIWQRTCDFTGKPVQYAITAKGTLARRHWQKSVIPGLSKKGGWFSSWEYLEGLALPASAVLVDGKKAMVRSDI